MQWALILTVVDTANDEGDEDSDALSGIAARIRASLAERGVTDMPQLRIR